MSCLHAVAIATLPAVDRDPFDRLLVAQYSGLIRRALILVHPDRNTQAVVFAAEVTHVLSHGVQGVLDR